MKLADIVERQELIRRYAEAGDHDVAHTEEDRLYREVLQAIAHGTTKSRILAAYALDTQKIVFQRWSS